MNTPTAPSCRSAAENPAARTSAQEVVRRVARGPRGVEQTIAVLLIGLLATGLLWHRSVQDATAVMSSRLDDQADRVWRAIEDQLAASDRMLHTARALFHASDHVTRNDWQAFAAGLDIGANAPGMISLGFVQRVPAGGIDAFLAEAMGDGVDSLTVRAHADADRELGAVGEHYIAKYAEPLTHNRSILGVDLATCSRNSRAYSESAASGQTRVSSGFRLHQLPGADGSLVIALPVLGSTADGTTEQIPGVAGWVTGVILTERLFNEPERTPMAGFLVELAMEDDSEPGGMQRLFVSRSGEHGADASLADASAVRRRHMHAFGRSMVLTLTPASAGLVRPDTDRATVTLVVGTLATALVALNTWTTTRTRARAVRLAHQMTDSLRESESRQRELAERAEQANQAKSDFLASMSHEIRTPMTAILGYADLLDSGEANPAMTAESVASIRQAGRHLLTIINDVLDLSKIESGRSSLDLAPCDLQELVRSVVATLGPLASRKGLALSASLDTPIPAEVLTDPGRVRQILINLVGNAVKFTETGRVSVHIAHRAGNLELSVRDTGIGIEPDQLGRIFLAFEQADNSASRRHEGTGLGLAISLRIAEMLGGVIETRSTLGEGSVFTLRVPAPAKAGAPPVTSLDRTPEANPTPPDAPLALPAVLEGRVLLAEDGPDNQRLISFILRKAGLEVEVVSNGREAVEFMERGERVDLIVTDMQMPEMDGYDATRYLRKAGFELPILALTAHAMEGDRERCLEAGCDDYEAKPIDRNALVSTVGRLLAQTRTAPCRAA